LVQGYLHAKRLAKPGQLRVTAVESVEKWRLFAYCEFLWNLKLAVANFLDVYVLEGHDSNLLHKAVGSVDIPNPNILHVQLEIEISGGVDSL
jgi:hypothetical protein